MSDAFNSYHLTSYRAMRGLLRSWPSLVEEAESGNYASLSIMLDLRKAFEAALSPRQREAVELLLIKGLRVAECASIMGIQWRVVYLLSEAGVTNLLTYLKDGRRTRWLPWEVDYIFQNRHVPYAEMAEKIGRSKHAIQCRMTQLRKRELGATAEARGRNSENARERRTA